MSTLRVGLIGRGAIGGVIADGITSGAAGDTMLAGVVRQRPDAGDEVAGVEELLERGCDMVIEAAGSHAVIGCAEHVIASGVDFMILSAGALADPAMEATIRGPGQGRVLISSGAIGGVDIIKAMRAAGSLYEVSITSTTVPAAVMDSLDEPTTRQVLEASTDMCLIAGTAREVALAFPKVANVAATLGLATLGLDSVQAELRVDPSGSVKSHALVATGETSRVEITIVNRLSPGNPRTSAVTPYAVLRYLAERDADLVVGV
jgi:aspartate dehydrogenase